MCAGGGSADRQNTRPHVWNCLATKNAKENTMIANRTRVVAKTLKAGARQMSSATEQEAKEQMGRWTQISKGMMALTGVYTAVQFVAHFGGHEHHEEAPKYSYLKLRNKPFPWHYANCDLLDSHCKELARAAEQALKDE